MSVQGSWLPPDLRAGPTEVVQLDGVSIVRAVVDADRLHHIASTLRARAEDLLARRSIASIIDVLDAASSAWLDPHSHHRQAALEVLPTLTGFSDPMVARSIDLEMRSSRADDLWGVLRSELGPSAVGALDGFVPCPHRPGRRVRAHGPSLTGAVFSSNIPALPHLTVMRALLLKSGFLGRTSSAEPVFLPLYLDSLHDLDPSLAACCAAVSWDRDRKDQDEVEAAFIGGVDAFVGWGGPAAERHFQERLPARMPAVFHGHRLGFAWVGRQVEPAAVVDGLARDVGIFDQHACLSPHVVFVEGDLPRALRVGHSLADALTRLTRELPARRMTVGRQAALTQRRLVAEMDAAMCGGQVWSVEGGGTVVVTSAEGVPVSPLDRWVSVIALPSTTALLARLRPLQGQLQNAALAVQDAAEADALRESLARLGVSRMCPPGAMATPSMVWHHDGRACVAAFVRWSDWEGVAPGDCCPLLDA